MIAGRILFPPASWLADDTVRGYKRPSLVERVFRRRKGVDLKVRPIWLRNPEHVKAHIFLCVLAYYVEWHLQNAWKELLFADEEPGFTVISDATPLQERALKLLGLYPVW